MKKNLYFLLSGFLMTTSFTFAQQVVNGDFENWTSKTYYEFPGSFLFTSNIATYAYFETVNVTKSSDKVSGNYAIRLETIKIDTINVSGLASTSDYNDMLSGKGGVPFSGRPDSLKCFAKFSTGTNDTAHVFITFKKKGIPNGYLDLKFYGSQATYKQYSQPILWFFPANAPLGAGIPDSMVIVISSSNLLYPTKVPGSTVTLDDVQFVGGTGTFPNGGFETWTPFVNEEPDNWKTLNYAVASKKSVTKTTDKNTGSYAMKIENVKAIWGDTIGYVSNGYFPADGNPRGGIAISKNPAKLSGYYKYVPVGNDTALAGMFLYKYNASKGVTEQIDSIVLKLVPKNTYTYFEVPVPANIPACDTLNISFAAGNYLDSSKYVGLGSVLYIDNVSLSFTGIDELNNEIAVKVYPNPASKMMYVDFATFKPSGNAALQLFDTFGKKVMEINETTGTRLKSDVSMLADGIYFYHVTTSAGEISKGKVVISR